MKKSICKKFDFIFSLLEAAGSLGTVIAVIITYSTLKEIQKQRIKANQPELVINNDVPFGIKAKIVFLNDTFPKVIAYTYNSKK